MNWNKITTLGSFAVVAFIIAQNLGDDDPPAVSLEPVIPNWSAIAAWPNSEATLVEAQPDPNQRVTAIILDDSGSMGADIVPAKAAVIDALDAMEPGDRVAVLALNSGTILPFSTVSDARAALPGRLAPIRSDGSTPLTSSIEDAMALLDSEAATLRGFGTYRLIVTTDGDADNGPALVRAIETLASRTPIQLTTIGIGIGGGHVLRREDLGSFVDVANVSALASALQAAVAENTDFTAITDFDATEG